MTMKRKGKIDVEKILKLNPHINKEQYEMIQKQQEGLKALGFKRAEYNLVIPFTRRIRSNPKSAQERNSLELMQVNS